MAKSIDEVVDQARVASGRVNSLIAAFKTIKQQLDEALSGVTLPPAVQTKVDSIFDIDTADATNIDAALSAPQPPPAG